MDDLDIDAILEGDDTDAIEALLDQMEETDEGIVFKQGDAGATDGDDHAEATEETGAEPGAEDDTAAGADSAGEQGALDVPAKPQEGGRGESRPVIEGKHGNNTIPYSELEAARQQAREADRRAQEAEQRAQQLQQQAQENSRMERQLEVLTKQLEQHGLEAESLPEDYQLTEEKQRELIEDYGEMGKAMVAMYTRLAQSQPPQPESPTQQPAEQPSADNEQQALMQAISRNADLEAWRTGDSARWQEAVRIDQILQADQKFANTSYDERFAEAVRRTKAVFGDVDTSPDAGKSSNQQQLDDKVRAAEEAAAPPPSLSNMGVGATSPDRPLVEQLADLSEDELAARMESMTDAQREALLSQIS